MLIMKSGLNSFLIAFKNLFIEPTKIVDNIYLGNAYNASNFNQLDEFNIKTNKIRVVDRTGKVWWVEPSQVSSSFL